MDNLNNSKHLDDVYNTVKDCTYYLDSKSYSKHIKIWALDNYADDVHEQLCKQLEVDNLINTPDKQSTVANNIHTYTANRPFNITYPDERNYGNEYENVYDNNYRDILEPFGQVHFDKDKTIIIVMLSIIICLVYCKYYIY